MNASPADRQRTEDADDADAMPAGGAAAAPGATAPDGGADAARLVFSDLETPTLTKAELSDLLFARLGLNKREAKEMVEGFFDIVHATVVQGEDVKLSGFGNFAVKRKAPRPGRNPRTGEVVDIGERQVVTFHASQKLKAIVRGEMPPADEFE